MSTAIDMYLDQITLTGGIPFAVTLPKAPNHINTDMMTASQIHSILDEGLADIENGKARPAKEVFKNFKEKYNNEAL
jgi:antitoxin component of RelBE/YafQ-DinJ toxin-antitoxin module